MHAKSGLRISQLTYLFEKAFPSPFNTQSFPPKLPPPQVESNIVKQPDEHYLILHEITSIWATFASNQPETRIEIITATGKSRCSCRIPVQKLIVEICFPECLILVRFYLDVQNNPASTESFFFYPWTLHHQFRRSFSICGLQQTQRTSYETHESARSHTKPPPTAAHLCEQLMKTPSSQTKNTVEQYAL